MKTKLNAVISTVYIFLSLFIVSAGLYVADGLPNSITQKINHAFSGLNLPQTSVDVFESMGSAVNVNINTVQLPEDMKAVWLDLTTDLTGEPADFFTEVLNYYNYFDNFYTDTLIIKPDTVGKYLGITDQNGNSTDALRYCLDNADKKGYFKILLADDSVVLDPAGNLNYDNIKYYLTNYAFDAVLLSSNTVYAANTLSQTAQYLKQSIDNDFKNIYFGIVAVSGEKEAFVDEQTLLTLNQNLADFLVIHSDASTENAWSYTAVVKNWNNLAQSMPNVMFYSMHRVDLVCSDKSGWSDYTEIADQMRVLWDCDCIRGSVFYSAGHLLNNKSQCAQRIAYLLSDGEYKDLAVKRISLDSENNTVTFTGYSASGHVLYCNNQSVSQSGGSFVLHYSLSLGTNTFTFFSCGKSITYRVYNNAHLIDACYPSGDINAAKDDIVTVMAVCMNNCEVVCALNGKNYPMTPDTGLSLADMPEGYCVYKCDISFTVNSYTDINLGNITVNAALDGNKETVTCGRVTLLKSNTSSVINRFLEFVYETFYGESQTDAQYNDYSDLSDKITPYRDNGYGQQLMCRVVNDDTETLGTAGEYNTYHADNSTLAKGTLDYVDTMTVSEEGYIRYELRSGLSVYGTNCELINNAYAMPKNRAVVNCVDDTGYRTTDILLDMDWFVPITVRCLPQTYYSGYKNYSYNVNAFTAQYVDVHLYYSDFYNSVNLQFSAESPFTHAEIYSDGGDGVILRLYLRKAGQFYGYNIYQNEVGQTVLSFKKHMTSTLDAKIIMLDPGHGGLSMTGTATQDQTVAEKTVTLKLALRVKELLENMGATVLITRTADTPLSLGARAELCCKASPDAFISIHLDGSESTSESGTHTFYYRPYSQPLAKAIDNSLVNAYRNSIYLSTSPNYASINRGIKYYPFYVNRVDDCPSVLVETGFMTNLLEGQVLTDAGAQNILAAAIANGIADYFAANYCGS